MAHDDAPSGLLAQIKRYVESIPQPDEAVDDVASRVGQRIAEAEARRRVLGVKQPRLEPTINFGHVLTIVSIIATGSISVGGGIWWTSAQLTRFQEQAGRFQEQLVSMRHDIDSVVTAGNDRQLRYGPRIDKIEADSQVQNRVQDERIQNLSVSLADQRKATTEMLTQMGTIREDIATIRARLSIGRRSDLAPLQEAR